MGRVSILSALLLASVAGAQTSYPMITHTTPVAIQRGKTAQLTVDGRMNFFGAYRVLVEGTGVEGKILGKQAESRPATGEVPNVARLQLEVQAAQDAALGVRDFRVATCLGVSSIGQLVVVDDPVVVEKGDNDTPAKAPVVALPCAVSGLIEKAEDVDCYRFRAEAGTTVSIEVLGARIEDRIHDLQKHIDPLIALHDAEGRELAANDDFYFADPQITYTFKQAGEYLVQIRDSKYDGDPRWVYAMIITDRPAVTHVYPMAGNPGQRVEVEPVGSAALTAPKARLQAPKEPGLHRVPLELGNGQTNPAPFLVDTLPQVLETEPNDEPGTPTRITLPAGVNGRIGQRRDLDHFAFKGTKGQALRFELFARRFGTDYLSSLDGVLDILDSKGKVLASNDDAAGKDALLAWTPPADGEYVLRVRDLNSKGGPEAIYYVACEPARPDFSLRCDPDKAMIGPGSSMTWFVHLQRQNGFNGAVEVHVEGLPAGVAVNPLTIPSSMTQGVLVVTAKPDAKKDAANVKVVGKAKVTIDDKEQELVRPARPNQEIYFPGGGRGTFDVSMQTVGVTDPSDILEVKVTPSGELRLKPGQEVKLDVEIKRRGDYDKAVSLDVLLRHLNRVYGDPLPPGVTMETGKSKTLLGTTSKGHITLKVDPKAAPVEKVPFSVMTHVSINFVVKVSYSSGPIWLTVET
jgi:hypothetical protein